MTSGQTSLFASVEIDGKKNGLLPPLRLQTAPPANRKDKLSWEKELLGLYVSEHPVRDYEDLISRMAVLPSKILKQQIGQRVKIGGAIGSIHKIITESGKPMLFVMIEDQRAKIEALIFPKILEKTPTMWQEGKIVLISGRLDDKEGNLKLLCDDVQELNQNHLNNYR